MIKILQTIWSSLTTENPNMITVISIPLTFIEIYISMLIFTTLLNINATKKQKWLYVLIASTFSIISRLFIPNPYNTYANLIFILLLVIILFKTNFYKGLLALIIPFVIAILVEAFFSKIYLLIFNIDYVVGMNIPLHRLFGTLIMYSVMYGIYRLLKIFKVNFSKIHVLNKTKKLSLIFNIIFAIILIASELYIITFYTYALPTFITIINIISIFTYVVVSFILYLLFQNLNQHL